MARKTLGPMVISTLLGISAAAFGISASAQPHGGGWDGPNEESARYSTRDQDRGPGGGRDRSGARDERGGGRGPEGHDKGGRHGRGDGRGHDDRRAAYDGPPRGHHAGNGPDRRRDDDFRRGGHLPAPYLNRHYRIADPMRHGLPPPGRGQRWFSVDGEFLLVAVTTGLILDLILRPR